MVTHAFAVFIWNALYGMHSNVSSLSNNDINKSGKDSHLPSLIVVTGNY